MTAPIRPETGNPDLARIRRNLAKLKEAGATTEEVQEYLATERTTPKRELRAMRRTPLEKVGQVAEGVIAGVPFANRAVGGYRALVDEMMGKESDVETERMLSERDLEDLPVSARLGLSLPGALALPLGPIKAAQNAGALGRIGANVGNAIIGGGAAGASGADLQGGDAGEIAGGAVAGATTAGLLTGGMGVAQEGAKALASLVRTPTARSVAQSKVVDALRELGEGDPQEGLRRAQAEVATRRAAGGDPMTMDILPRGENMARAARNAPFSAAGREVPEALAARAAETPARAMGAVERGSGLPSGVDAGRMVDEIEAVRTQLARPLFQRAEQEAMASGGTANGPAMGKIRDQLAKNPLLQRLVNETREVPDLVDVSPDSYEVLDRAYKSINERIRDARLGNDTALAGRLDQLRAPLLDALSEIAPSYRKAAQQFAEASKPLNSFQAGLDFKSLSPYDINKALSTGKLPGGYDVDVESFRYGVGQALRETIEGASASPAMEGVARTKNPVTSVNNKLLDRQLREALGDGYDELVPAFREIFREFTTANRVGGGSNTTQQLLDDPSIISAGLERMSGGIGFGKDAALRRFVMGAATGGLRQAAEVGAGKRATEIGRVATARGSALDNLLAELQKSFQGQSAAPAKGSITAGWREVPSGLQRSSALQRLLAELAGRQVVGQDSGR